MITPQTYIGPNNSYKPWIPSSCVLVEWLAMGNTDIGIGVISSDLSDKTVQMDGSFSSATATLEGSNDSTDGTDGTWFVIRDATSTPLQLTSGNVFEILENPLWIRPRISGGISASINVRLNCCTTRRKQGHN